MSNWKEKLLYLMMILMFGNCTSKKFSLELSDLHTPYATSTEREKFKNELIQNKILTNLSQVPNEQNESRWRSSLWSMELLGYRSDSTFNIIKRVLSNFDQLSEYLQRALLEAVHCLYPDEFIGDVTRIAQTTQSPKIFSMAIFYLRKVQNDRDINFFNLLQEKFPNWRDHPILFMLGEDLKVKRSDRFQSLPALVDLLKHAFAPGMTIVYSFQRHDRSYPGLTVIKNPAGKFVRDHGGNIFHISHLARAISNLPGYITNGNTPQGIFSIQGLDVSNNYFIGRTPNLQLLLPCETGVKEFFHGRQLPDTAWTIALYQKLLPENWKNYFPIYEAYYAGAAGRTEIIAHGTTIDPEYYRGTSYYPNTPSLGCLTAKEIWSGKNGSCLISDQLSFINAFRSAGTKNGYLIVVELDDRKQPVVLDEIIMDILKAEEVAFK